MTDLAELDPQERRFGGKACGLARLAAAQARVPLGFAVEATGEPPERWAPASRETFRARVRALLAHGPIAVRSSALGEDGAERSFAGLFESVLGVEDEAGALAAAARCIASGASARVGAYAGGGRVPVGLVLQRLVTARAAGVCFTRDPSGRDAALLIEAVKGRGDALVSGHVQPQRSRVYATGAGRLEVQHEALPDGEVLAESEAVEIARGARRLAAALAGPLDLEWALDSSGSLWWLQARPITAAVEPPPPPHVELACPGADDGPVVVWSNMNVRETMPDPLTPLSWSVWRDRMFPALVAWGCDLPRSSPIFAHLQAIDRVQGRVYGNVNAMLGLPGTGRIFWALMETIDADAAARLRPLHARGVFRARRLPGPRTALWAGMATGHVRAGHALLRALRPERTLREMERHGEEILRRRRSQPLSAKTLPELLHEIRAVSEPGFLGVRRMFGALLLSMLFFALASRLFRRHPEAARLLAVGIANNPTTQMSVGIEELAAAAGPCADLFLPEVPTERLFVRLAGRPEGRLWLEGLDAFLRKNGQRCPKEFDLSVPRWSEDPGMIVELVRAALREPPKEGVRERLERLARERRAAVEAAVARAPAWQRPLLRFAARLTERHLPLREAGKHYALMALARVRDAVLEIGARLAADGRLAERDDVFFLDLAELDALAAGRTQAELGALVAQRRARLAEQAAHPAPDFVRSDGVPVPGAAASSGSAEVGLRGTGVSTGRARGRVRVLTSPDPRALQVGEVLVVRFADPGWTPLFPRAAALVMEVGGVMCHAAVVARELGIPAVFGVSGATALLRDGDEVEVDADAGLVRYATSS